MNFAHMKQKIKNKKDNQEAHGSNVNLVDKKCEIMLATKLPALHLKTKTCRTEKTKWRERHTFLVSLRLRLHIFPSLWLYAALLSPKTTRLPYSTLRSTFVYELMPFSILFVDLHS